MLQGEVFSHPFSRIPWICIMHIVSLINTNQRNGQTDSRWFFTAKDSEAHFTLSSCPHLDVDVLNAENTTLSYIRMTTWSVARRMQRGNDAWEFWSYCKLLCHWSVNRFIVLPPAAPGLPIEVWTVLFTYYSALTCGSAPAIRYCNAFTRGCWA